MADLFYEIGILPTKEYSECSAADLVAQFVGQSAPKTREVLRSALGKVLFVDEAYRLRDGEFGKEAVNEIVDCLTKPDFMGKLVVILAGYTDDMNSLLKLNPGLASRFPEEVIFENMKPHDCLVLLKQLLQEAGLGVTFAIDDQDSDDYHSLCSHLRELSMLPSWGNGRDIKNLSKKIAAAAFEGANVESSSVTASGSDILQALESMLAEQKARNLTTDELTEHKGHQIVQAHSATANPPVLTNTTTSLTVAEQKVPELVETPQPQMSSRRDANVSDEIWEQLQLDIKANEAAERSVQKAIETQERAVQHLRAEEDANGQNITKLESLMQEKRDSVEEDDDLRRKFEQERLRALALKHSRDEEEMRLRKLREEAEKRRRKEAQAQQKLKDMGVCPVGFRWTKQGNGYRCAGGSHFVTNSQLGV